MSTEFESLFINERFQSEWWHRIAVLIASKMDMNKLGVKGVYLCGSTESYEAGPMSDIDLIIHIGCDENKKEVLMEWLGIWDSILCELINLINGYQLQYILDIHLISDRDIEMNTCFALKITSVREPAELLRIAQ